MSLRYKNATDAWEDLYQSLLLQYQDGFKQPSRAGNVVGEIIGEKIVIEDPSRGFVTSPIRKLPVRYAVGELMWYLSGSNRLQDIKTYSRFWEDISDDGETLNSAYGHRISHRFGFDQWEYCKALINKDTLTRQAVIHIKDADDRPTKDTPCTVALQFLVRDGALDTLVYMRSNDIWLGFPFDVFCFTSLQVKMAMELGLELGNYTHFVGSLHLYEKDVKADAFERRD
jgi:thymidylate synthase